MRRIVMVGLVLALAGCGSKEDTTLDVRYVAPRPVPRVVQQSVDPLEPPVWVLPEGQACPDSYPIKAIKHIPRYDAWYYQPGEAGYDAIWPDACYLSTRAAYDAGYDPRLPATPEPVLPVEPTPEPLPTPDFTLPLPELPVE